MNNSFNEKELRDSSKISFHLIWNIHINFAVIIKILQEEYFM
jgi:hypothetical protein